MAPSVAAEVARRYPRIDLALVAINDLRVRPQFMKQLSMSPDDAANVVHALGARVAVPIHYRYHGSWLQDALLLSHEGTPELFADALHRVAPATVLLVLTPGQPLIIE
jgi:L-ascorbate metabolism protein UlaG (beta-lactamase superfamily)